MTLYWIVNTGMIRIKVLISFYFLFHQFQVFRIMIENLKQLVKNFFFFYQNQDLNEDCSSSKTLTAKPYRLHYHSDFLKFLPSVLHYQH